MKDAISNEDVELMFEKGLSLNDISEFLKIELDEVKKILAKYVINMSTSNYKIEIVPMKEKEFLKLKSDRVIGITEDYFSYFSLIKNIIGRLNLAEVYFGLKSMSGGSEIRTSGHKNSFLFIFKVYFLDYKNEKTYVYFLKVKDWKGGLTFEFGRNVTDREMDKFKELINKKEINPIDEEISRDVLNSIIRAVIANINDETKKFQEMKIENFKKTIEVPEIEYGYRDGIFYQKNLYEEEN